MRLFMQRVACALMVLAAMSPAAFAGDYAQFHFIGFSRDGKYLAFEDYGITDSIENSNAYSSIYLINTAKNSLAVAPFMSFEKNVNRGTELDLVRDKNGRLARKQLKRYGIVAGNTGTQVIAHLINQFPLVKGNLTAPRGPELLPHEASFTKWRNSQYREGFYSLRLELGPGPKQCKGFTLYSDAFKVGTSLILQSSDKVPPSWLWAHDFGIREVFLYRGRMAVFIGVFSFDWDDLHTMVVTGDLDD